MHLLGWAGIVVLIALFAVNAVFMLVSPKAWFRLPGWILAKGTLTEKRYATGLGALEVRITGASMLGLIGWVLYQALFK
jgi:hypothetical protein